jgi:glucosyl-dolichyl phosphate glucuronosyltransferase
MNITVILCTHNRYQMLQEALKSAMLMKLPEDVSWEVLVVDNNSSDSTPEVVNEISSCYPGRVRYLFEAKPGKSHALNAGIRAARGDVLAFMDDDVTVDPLWLRSLTSSLDRDEWTGSGGRVVPLWACSPPAWIPRESRYLGALAMFDLGPEAGQLTKSPIGTNMAFKKTIFQKYGGFRTDLGPCPGSEIRGEDSEFCIRVLSAGERLRYEPSAVVYHPVQQHRIQKKYFLSWWFWLGRGSVRLSGKKADVWGVPRPFLSILRAALLIMARGLGWMFSSTVNKRFFYKLQVWMLAGCIVEFFLRLREYGRNTRIQSPIADVQS